MRQQGIVVFADASTGRFGMRLADGSHVLAEQLDVQPLHEGDEFYGWMDALGVEALTAASGNGVSVFVLAHGLSREAIEKELGVTMPPQRHCPFCRRRLRPL
ncbi:hypothetical protein [Massilia sp. CFBP9026]|uniref:hypothetical protein n=1 Tax=Massilia sp. CFBP9026 TaxID=3096536 RepID=UPI002A6B14EA|nr:hypothetical protein [Massilia sp. CFBP9026]MDY0963569.1 hypothetical protein [Massilia sp. CFBP9026]